MWILRSDKVTGTCNESDRTCLNEGSERKYRLMLCSLDLCHGKELLMQSSQYGRCKRNMVVKERSSTFAFVDLEKAFDRVPREVTRWALRKAGMDEWLVKAVMVMYEGAQTVVRTTEGDSKAFNVKVGLQQGSVLSPLLFVIVMEMISRELRAGLPLQLLYADDLILMAESEESLRDKIVKWKSGWKQKVCR